MREKKATKPVATCTRDPYVCHANELPIHVCPYGKGCLRLEKLSTEDLSDLSIDMAMKYVEQWGFCEKSDHETINRCHFGKDCNSLKKGFRGEPCANMNGLRDHVWDDKSTRATQPSASRQLPPPSRQQPSASRHQQPPTSNVPARKGPVDLLACKGPVDLLARKGPVDLLARGPKVLPRNIGLDDGNSVSDAKWSSVTPSNQKTWEKLLGKYQQSNLSESEWADLMIMAKHFGVRVRLHKRAP